MANPFGILALTGTVEQLVTVGQHLVNSYKALEQNAPRAEKLLTKYAQLYDELNKFSAQPFESAMPDYIEMVEQQKPFIKQKLDDALRELKNKAEEADKLVEQAVKYTFAAKDTDDIEKLATDADQILRLIFELRSQQNQSRQLDKISRREPEVFTPRLLTEKTPTNVIIDLDSRDADGSPDTPESKLKKALLVDASMLPVCTFFNSEPPIGAIATGQSGMGNTCTLRAIANDRDVYTRFTGGIYFLTMGIDAREGKIIEELCRAVSSTGGINVASKMKAEENLLRVMLLAKSWFKGPCLFIIDGIDSGTLFKISELAKDRPTGDAGSNKILCSSGDPRLDMSGVLSKMYKEVQFTARKQDRAAEILLKIAGFDVAKRNDAECKQYIETILDKCAGLPLALNVAGMSVRRLAKKKMDHASDAWEIYAKMVNDPLLFNRERPGDGYNSLEIMLQLSLNLLDDNSRTDGKQFPNSFQVMHRALCVLKREGWMPLSLLKHLWGTCNLHDAKTVLESMESVGVAELRYKNGSYGVRLHHLTKDFADRQAQSHSEIKKWHKKLLAKYGADSECVACTLSECGMSAAENEYMCENVYRICGEADCYGYVFHLLLSARWILRVVRGDALRCCEEGVTEYDKQARHSREAAAGGDGYMDEDTVKGLQLIVQAARLSAQFASHGDRATHFQLYGRLFSVPDPGPVVREFLVDVERWAPKPWLKPARGCLTSPGGALVHVFNIGEHVRIGQETDEGWIGWAGYYGESELRVFEKREGQAVTEMQYRREGNETHISPPVRKTHCASKLVQKIERMGTCCRSWLRKGTDSEESGTDAQATSENFGRDTHSHAKLSLADVCESIAVAGYQDGAIAIWSRCTHRLELLFQAHNEVVYRLAVSRNGRRVVSVAWDRTPRVWDPETGAAVCAPLTGHEDLVESLALSADGRVVVSGSRDNTARVWDAETGAAMCAPLTGHMHHVWSVAVSDDGQRVVSGSVDNTVRVWDVETGAVVCAPLTGCIGLVRSVAVSGNGRRVVSDWDEKTVRVWDAETGTVVCTPLTGHTRQVESVAVSVDGRRVVSGSSDKTVCVSGVETGHTGRVWSVTMSADGRHVVSGSVDDTVRVWDVESGKCVKVTSFELFPEIVDEYCGTTEQGGAGSIQQVEEFEIIKNGDNSRIVLVRNDGTEETLAEFESLICELEVNKRYGIVVAGLVSGAVPILRIMK